MGLSTAQGNYYFESGQYEGINAPQPGAGPEMLPQAVQGTRRVDTIATYAGRSPQGPNQADTHDAPLQRAWPPRGVFRARAPWWKGTQHVPPEQDDRRSGIPDPPASGPQRPSLHFNHATWSMWAGSDVRSYADDLSRSYNSCDGNVRKRRLPVGQQDGTYTRIAGGQVGFHRQYRRATWDAGPAAGVGGTPDVVAPHQAQGAYVFSGPPHGLHSQTAPDGIDLLNTRLGSPQMRSVRVDRLANSQYIGQAYSMSTLHQGQANPVVSKVTKSTRGVRRGR